jgi:hypothetical protein
MNTQLECEWAEVLRRLERCSRSKVIKNFIALLLERPAWHREHSFSMPLTLFQPAYLQNRRLFVRSANEGTDC